MNLRASCAGTVWKDFETITKMKPSISQLERWRLMGLVPGSLQRGVKDSFILCFQELLPASATVPRQTWWEVFWYDTINKTGGTMLSAVPMTGKEFGRIVCIEALKARRLFSTVNKDCGAPNKDWEVIHTTKVDRDMRKERISRGKKK
jgi:hypothetical protein